MKLKLLKTSAGFAVGALFSINASASLVDLGPGSFTALAPVITYDTTESPLGTVDPSITLAAGSLGNVTVSSAGSFVGQTVYAIHSGVNSISGTPTGPLTLNTGAGGATVSTVNDSAPGATSPVLAGTPTFNGPISILFSTPVAAVGLKGGYFDAIGSTEIQAFDVNGNSLGSIFNSVLGFQFYGLADSTGAEDIAGISFYINGTEPAGFEIDNLTFGAAEQVIIPSAPDTGSTVALLLGSVLGLALFQRRFSVATR
jgi:hypothetical protein